MAKSKKLVIDLSRENLSFEERNQTIKLLNFRTDTMSLDIAIFEKEKFINRVITGGSYNEKENIE